MFNSPPHGSTGSATTISGESLFLSKKPVTANGITRRMTDAKELATQLEDFEAEAEYNLRNYPANQLDEIALVEDYEESLAEMKRI